MPEAIALTLLWVLIWLLTHRYRGLSQDARLYAVQALANIDVNLKSDLYLQNTSQDRYSVFSPFYAQAIRLLGLPNAARALNLSFATGFAIAAWDLTRKLLSRDEAYLAVGALMLIVGGYGAHGVFHYLEDYLTARSAAEMLIIAALAIYARGSHRMALLLAASAMLVHPLMALPGVILVIVLMTGTQVALSLAVAGIALTSALALTVPAVPLFRSILPVMDTAWLSIVKERSEFLFLQLWSLEDWDLNLRPFASLALSAMILNGATTRRLCFGAALVGASGLLVALVAGTVGPVALLVQGQAWRWIWIAVFISVILMLPTAVRLWQNERCGPLCAVLLVASWTASVGDAPALALVASALFAARYSIADSTVKYLNWAAALAGVALFCWELSNVVTTGSSISSAGIIAASEFKFWQSPVTTASLRFPLAVTLLLIWKFLTTSNNDRLHVGASLAIGAACAFLIPIAFTRSETVGSTQEVLEFADWRSAIPPTAAVYVANGHDAASFGWFTLQRPNYLSLDQSAGVVFSRATALEVQRRAQVLMPLMDEDWELLSRNSIPHNAGEALPPPRRTPLTATSLVSLCRDPQLGFLIAREDVGFEPLAHRHPGLWLNWNLYDCDHVRSLSPVL